MHDDHQAPGPRHNAAPHGHAQWQTPHRAPDGAAPDVAEPDFDLVEAAFAEGFAASSDPTSFLRLARVVFEGADATGRRLRLLRVELEQVTDVGAVAPHLGGGTLRYDPLPARLVSRRRRLRLIYHDGAQLVACPLAVAQALVP